MDDDATQALNQIAAILKIAHQDAIAEAASAVRADKTSNAILASTSKWISTGPLQSAAVKKGASSKRTVLRRLPELVGAGFLERREVSGGVVEYKSSGLA